MEYFPTSVYIADASILNDEKLFALAYSKVSVLRQSKTDEFKQKTDKILSLTGELLLFYVLQNAGIDTAKTEFFYGENFKPYIKNQENFFYNISHSGNYAICAISTKEVGCDIEKTGNANIKLAKRFFTNEEYEFIAKNNDKNIQDNLFYRYWTLKESFVKNIGKGLNLSFNKFKILINSDKIVLIQNLNNIEYYFKEYAVSGYNCSVCSLLDDFNSEIIPVDLSEFLQT